MKSRAQYLECGILSSLITIGKRLRGCRWGRTPLQDAVDSSHIGMVAMLRKKGGILQESLSAMQVFPEIYI